MSKLGCALFLAAIFACAPASALDLEADLSTHYIEIRTTFQGAQLTVFGAVTGAGQAEAAPGAPAVDVIVVVRGPVEALAIRRKEEIGPIWVNRTSLVAKNVPSFYYVASTRPLADIVGPASLARYQIGLQDLAVNLGPPRASSLARPRASSTSTAQNLPQPIGIPVRPDTAERATFKEALDRLLTERRSFVPDHALTFVRPHLFRADVNIPSTVPEGDYGVEVYAVRNREVVDAEYTVFFIDKKGLEGKIYGLSQHNPILHGLLAVFIAVAAGWISELSFRKR